VSSTAAWLSAVRDDRRRPLSAGRLTESVCNLHGKLSNVRLFQFLLGNSFISLMAANFSDSHRFLIEILSWLVGRLPSFLCKNRLYQEQDHRQRFSSAILRMASDTVTS